MQDAQEFPDSFVLTSVLGTFIMEPYEDGYRGSVGAHTCITRFNYTNHGLHATVTLSSINGRVSLEAYALNLEDMCQHIANWMDSTFADEIADYASDVKYLETESGKLAYWAYNTDLDNVPIVFVHGGPGGDSNPVKARRLRTGHPVYLFDQMGCGMSDPIRSFLRWKVSDYVAQMREFIESIPSDEVIIYGASWGAGLTLAYAKETDFYKIKAMILCSPFLSTKLWNRDAMENLRAMGGDYYERMRGCLRRKDYGIEFKSILAEYNSRYLFNLPEHREWAINAAFEEPNEVFRKLCGPNDMVTNGKLKRFDVTDVLDRIEVPVLFMAGDSDSVTQKRLMEYHSRVKGSRISIIPFAGHVLASEQFDAYRETIMSFIRDLDRPRTENRYIAYCGIDCMMCDGYRATRDDDEGLRRRVAEKWSKLNDVPILPEMINCCGCRTDGQKTAYCESMCAIRKCAREKGFSTCAECADKGTCEKVRPIMEHHPEARTNLGL